MKASATGLGRLALPAVLLAAALAASATLGCARPDEDAPAAPADETMLTVSDDGVGALGPATPFDTAAVRAALPPGFAVDRRPAPLADDARPVLAAFADGLLVLDVYPDSAAARLARIDVLAESALGPGGARVGQSFAEAGGAAMACAPGTGDLAGRAVCTPPGVARVRLVFAYGGVPADGGALPPADALGRAILERFVWNAP